MINLSTKDMTYGPSIFPVIHFESPKEENLSTKNKSAEFMLSPKCPLFGGSSTLSTAETLITSSPNSKHLSITVLWVQIDRYVRM